MSQTLAHLKQHEEKAINEFLLRLSRIASVQTDSVWLFGSKSRGDFDDDADIDLLLVLEKADWKRKERIRMADSRVSLEYDVLLNTHILSRERWEELAHHQATLWREIQRDGVPLLSQLTRPGTSQATTQLTLPPINLEWSDWTSWDDLRVDARQMNGTRVPNREAGVYEVKYRDAKERLTIGKTSNLRLRIKQGLVRGTIPHSAGKKIRANEDVSRIVIRWAITDRPAAVEEELHKRHLQQFGRLPKYTQHT